jgi:hypothetical protein
MGLIEKFLGLNGNIETLNDLMSQILITVGGAGFIVFGLSAWLGNVWANRIEKKIQMASQIDLDLRKRRIEVYKELWEFTDILPNWPRAKDVTYDGLKKYSEDLKNWYFHKGGMYLSRKTHHNGYSPLQTALSHLLKENHLGKVSDKNDKDHYESIRKRCSTLRTCLTEDIESRREGPL